MFDNPKKELERLEQQLLEAERSEPEAEDGDFSSEEIEDFFLRSAGFDDDRQAPSMDAGRYVPAPPKKGIGGLVTAALLLALSVIALALWGLGRLL